MGCKFRSVMLIAFTCLLAACKSNPGFHDITSIFMNALKESNHQEAYDLLAPELQQEVGTVNEFRAWVEGNGLIPMEWRMIESFLVAQGMIEQGKVTFQDREELDFSFFMKEIGEGLIKIYKIQFGTIFLQSQD